jgi:hypothetical protein
MPGFCEYGNEPPGYIKGKKCIDQLTDYQIPKKDSAPQGYLVKLKLPLRLCSTQ